MSKSASNALVLIILLVTFPLWIGLAGGLFGLAIGLFGAVIGIIAGFFGILGGILGAMLGAIAEVFNWIFGGVFSWSGHYFPHVYFPRPFTVLLIVLAIVWLTRSRKKEVKK
ncbi:MAG: hypothetical protein KF725_01695 [Cyclobacteriaceae bacterium]|nr:hypothetical protein [Cyclobacteriaceae bacterium]UYN86838.1 MAG: hypothetical protein KIT51_00710 [Cyclobacteriaceae bacterium]